MRAGVPCVLFGCWFSPWEPRGYRLIHIVVPPEPCAQSNGHLRACTSVFVRPC
ncbi:hypothetical protein T03_16002 [Trichinella britovi]|uniref:Uncharacterized protein n=1 Tax=Trichinella britovi TaxID=45882 RepID=A0A0V0Z232_TRIBR|nr:hypothetical protein T03_16002 [Trichinella britovi]